MKNLNEITLIGNLGQDPEVRTVGDDQKLTKFSVATTRYYNDNKYTDWHLVVAWGDQIASYASNYLEKGSYVYIRGRMNYRTYEDDSGNTRYFAEIVAREVSGLAFEPTVPGNQSTEVAEDYRALQEAAPELDLVPANQDAPSLPF